MIMIMIMRKSHLKHNDSTAGFTFESRIVLTLVVVVAIVAVIISAILALWSKLLRLILLVIPILILVHGPNWQRREMR